MRNAAFPLFAGLLFIAATALAQQDKYPPAVAVPVTETPAMDCKAMMQEMQTANKAMDDRLRQLVDEMNRASGPARIDSLTAVVNELVTQRLKQRDQMTKMMAHMSQHMQGGGMKAMAACPMMKGASATPSAEPRH